MKSVVVDRAEIKANFWDLSGHPEFFEVRNEFYKDTQGCILVFDVTSRKSFESMEGWIAEATRYGLKSCPLLVCGNKVCSLFLLFLLSKYICEGMDG